MPHGVGAHFYPMCDSTNTVAARYAESGETSPIWIVAGKQSGGRGRKGKTWVSEEGNLYASLLFRPDIEATALGALPFLMALAVRDTLIELGALANDVKCKWPNDILLAGRKICGILIESSSRSSGRLDHVIIGVGINLLHSPADAQFNATSLLASLGRPISVQEALGRLANQLNQRLDAWDVENFEPVRVEWTRCAWGLGQFRRIDTAKESFEAKLVGLDTQGGLLVQMEDGTERQIVAADIFATAAQSDKDS